MSSNKRARFESGDGGGGGGEDGSCSRSSSRDVEGSMSSRRNGSGGGGGSGASACTECQRRKGKCVGGRPCNFCAKTGRKCVDQPQVARIPLTRKNMDDLHDRCQRLEEIIRNIDPSIDIEDLLGGGSSASLLNRNRRGDRQASESSGSPTSNEDGDHSETEEDPNPQKFEWHEELDADGLGMADGMASLNIDSRQVGYLGKSSAAALLRHVYRLLKAHHQTSGTRAINFAELIVIVSTLPSPKINRHMVTFTTETLVDAYFHYHHTSYPLVHEAIFRKQIEDYRSGVKKPNSHWTTLYRMIMVMGAFMSSTVRDGPEASIEKEIYKEVNEGFSKLDFFSYGTLEGVQALTLMGAYLQKRDNPNTGYNFLGMAMRMALGLGLHREITDHKNTNTLGLEIRRRTWWTLYIFDVGASITFGRPTIPSDKIYTKIPANVIDYHITDTHATLPAPVDQVTCYSAMIAHANLAILMNRIHFNIFVHPNTLSRPLSRELITKFDSQLTKWQLELPSWWDAPPREDQSWFPAAKAIIQWKSLNLRMLMYKHFLDVLTPQHSFPIALNPEVRKCLSFALESVNLINTFCLTHQNTPLWHGVGWYATYYVFQSALVLISAILTVPNDASVSVWKDGVQDAFITLEAVGACTPSAGRVKEVLMRCVASVEELDFGRPPKTAESNANSNTPDTVEAGWEAGFLQMEEEWAQDGGSSFWDGAWLGDMADEFGGAAGGQQQTHNMVGGVGTPMSGMNGVGSVMDMSGNVQVMGSGVQAVDPNYELFLPRFERQVGG